MTTLQNQLAQLQFWLRQSDKDTEWNGVLIGEEKNIFDDGKIVNNLVSVLSTVEEFEPTFNELVNSGFSWINLSSIGVFKNKLVVCVEKPSYVAGVSKEQLSINFSGSTKII